MNEEATINKLYIQLDELETAVETSTDLERLQRWFHRYYKQKYYFEDRNIGD